MIHAETKSPILGWTAHIFARLCLWKMIQQVLEMPKPFWLAMTRTQMLNGLASISPWHSDNDWSTYPKDLKGWLSWSNTWCAAKYSRESIGLRTASEGHLFDLSKLAYYLHMAYIANYLHVHWYMAMLLLIQQRVNGVLHGPLIDGRDWD